MNTPTVSEQNSKGRWRVPGKKRHAGITAIATSATASIIRSRSIVISATLTPTILSTTTNATTTGTMPHRCRHPNVIPSHHHHHYLAPTTTTIMHDDDTTMSNSTANVHRSASTDGHHRLSTTHAAHPLDMMTMAVTPPFPLDVQQRQRRR
ncbi:hypothetical protein SCLCIDRAFT_643240 [Scleroderma citrinum Foug A]|uniref:Uncharacterized protein n=1 Tax=Scleroderma citrinum Foug A TaxID=1036808 RepID=A0A0C3E8I4_9AGAM|nr:hypothetical protein SCLCIDRAFT_643240 [Scleroderma citrinum Foug A]